MGEFLEPDDPMPDFVPAKKRDLPDANFGDIFGASVEQMRATDLTSSNTENRLAAFAEIEKAVTGVFGGDTQRMSEAMDALDVPELDGISLEQQQRMSVGSAYDRARLARFKAFRNSQPPEIRATIPDPDRIEQSARDIALRRYTEAEEVMGQAKGLGGGTAKFLGGMTGAMTDPVNLASMAIFHKPMTTFKGAVLYGATTSGGTEAVLQPFVQQYREEVGLPAGWDVGFQNVFFATVGGGVFGAVEGGLIKLGQAIDARKRKGIATVIDDRVGDIIARHEAGEIDAEGVKEEFAALAQREPAFAAAVEISERAAAARDVDGSNPYGLTPEAVEAHRARLANATAEAIDTPAPFTADEVPAAPAVTADAVPPEWASLGLEVVDYRALARDAKRFQFKEADGDGLTDALKDVGAWEPERAGVLLVWEGKDGTRYVANGHQRHGLAQRLMDAGGDPISGPAFVLREADGVTAEDAMVRGALVNIGEGSGTSLDAARILRASPETGATLPPRSPLVREGRGLAQLSDEAFGLVVNGKVSSRNAALVGRDVPDPALQAQIALALQRVDPRTATEARSIIQDLQATPIVEGVTIDLFGESGFKRALIAERASVKAAALRLLGSDIRAFSTLTKRADRIEAEGNTLDTGRNSEVKAQSARLAERLEREAHVKGEISDALNAAAQAVASGEPAIKAARGLVDALTGGPERGRAGGGPDALGGSQGQPAGPRAGAADAGEPAGGGADLLGSAPAGARPGMDELLADPELKAFEQEMAAVSDTVPPDMTIEDLASAGRSYVVDGQTVDHAGALAHLHQVAEAYAGGKVDAGRKVTIVIGPPAAGKSTIAQAYAKADRAAIVDSDDAKTIIPEYNNGVGANAVHKESKLLANDVMADMIVNGKNLVIPRIGSKEKELDILVRGLISESYDVSVVRVDVQPDEAARRMVARYRQTGRLIPTDYFKSIGDGPKTALAKLNKEGIKHAEIDYNGPKGVADFIAGDKGLLDKLHANGFRPGPGRGARDAGNVRDGAAPQGRPGEARLGGGEPARTAREAATEAADEFGADVAALVTRTAAPPAGALDLASGARLGRAEKAGFATGAEYYHATNARFPGEPMLPSKDGLFGPGIYLSRDAAKAGGYAGEAGQILPVFIRGKLADHAAWKAARAAASRDEARGVNFDVRVNRRAQSALQADGYAGLSVGDTVTIFDPVNVRSVFDAFDPKTDTAPGLFARDASVVGSPAELSRTQTLFVRDEGAAIRRALAEAAACAGGVPMAGLGQLAAGSAIGLGIGLAMGGVALTQGSEAERAARYDAYVDTAPEMADERVARQRARNVAAMRKETRGSYYEHKAMREEATVQYRKDLDSLETVSQFHANLWGERFTGVDAGFLDDMLHHESSGDWTARPEVGSAYGGFQFIDSTWRRMMREHGASYGLKLDPRARPGTPEYEALMELRSDQRWGTVMAAEYAKENAAHMERVLRRPITQKEAYLGHFLGSGTALKLLRAGPDKPAADLLPAEAKNNMNVFYINQDVTRPRTVKQVIARQARDFSNALLFPAEAVDGGET